MTNPHTLKPGQIVSSGRFTLTKELGRGGMGVVWLAQDTSLGEQVALKFLPTEVCHDPVALNDLRRETARSHRLTHANIIRIHDFHQQPDGDAFISMEYVDGPTLSGSRLQQSRQVFAWEQLAPLVKQLCTALAYAHGEGVIHRDLKPANVMLDSRGRVKLADFGIAAVVSNSMGRVTARTGSGSGGTLAYMSPQQLRGQPPTVADDVYALGASLYELLTGRPPFYTGDITHQVLNEPPTPVGERLLSLGVANVVPSKVAELIMACLSKDPAQRPASIAAVAALVDLATLTAKPVAEMVEAEIPWLELPPPPAKPVAKIVVMALLALGLAVVAWQYLLPPGQQPPERTFSQRFLVHGPDGPGNVLTNTDLVLVVQYLDAFSNAPVGLDGQALLKDLPPAWKNQEARVSLSSRDWQLAGATNTFRLSGETIELARERRDIPERRDILIHGQVSESGSNAPLAEVFVSVAGLTNVTDARGQFSLTIPGRIVRLPMTLTAHLPRYQPFSRTLTNLAEAQSVSLVAIPKPPPFTQVLVLHGPGGTNDVPDSSDIVVILQSGDWSREVLVQQGEAVFTNLPAASTNQSAEVSLSAKDWQLLEGTNRIQLSGQRIEIGLERREIVVRGSVTVTNSATPLPEALVAIGGVTNTTDQSGRFSVSVPGRLLGSPLTLAVTLSDYQPFSREISDPAREQAVSLAPVPKPPSDYPIINIAETNLVEAIRQCMNRTPKSLKSADKLSKQAVAEYRPWANTNFTKYGTALAIALLRRAEILALIPSDREAGECYLEAKGVCLRLGPNNPFGVSLARVLNNYAVSLSDLKDPRQNPRIVDAYQQAITLYSNAVPSVPAEALPGQALAYHNLGRHQREAEDFVGAVVSYQEAVRIYQAPPVGQDAEVISRRVQAQSELASTLNQQSELTSTLDKRGRREMARTNYLAAIAACEGLQKNHRRLYLELLAGVQSDYARFLKPADPTAALLAYELAISLYGDLEAYSSWTNRTDFAHALNNYAVLLAKPDGPNRAPEADLAYQKALAQCRAAGDRPLEVVILGNLGLFLRNQGRLTEARTNYLEALKVGAKYLDQQPAEIGPPLADVHLKLGELEYSQCFGLDRADRTTHFRAATKQVKEARKRINELPASSDKTYLESWAKRLGADIVRATSK